MVYRRILLGATGALIGLAAASVARPEENLTVRFDVSLWAVRAGMHLAQEKGRG
jgi:hypothetical protein